MACPPFVIALLPSFYAGSDPTPVTRDAKESKFVTFANCTIKDNQAILGSGLCYKERSYLTYSFNGICQDTIAKDLDDNPGQ